MAGTDRVGQILGGKLRVVRLLDTGGMGAVYVAEHLEIGKQVAVKFLLPEYAANEEVVRRFSQEARAAAAIGHPGIIDVHDVGKTEDGAPYIVMQLLEGESLRAAITRQGIFAVDRAVAILLRVLSALRAAHAKGIVHRDIKPDNIFLEGPRGRPLAVKLLDFGVAKMSEAGAGHVTRTGMTLGTGDYMAPEQAQGLKDVDHRVDVWAAGVVLYELVTGRTPFKADNYNAMIAQILTEPIPSPASLRPDLPETLEAAIMRALTKDRDRRFPSAEAFARAIAPHAGAGAWDDDVASEGIAGAPTVPAGIVSGAGPGAEAGPLPTAPSGTDAAARLRARRVLVAGVTAAVIGIGGIVAWAVSSDARVGAPSGQAIQTAPGLNPGGEPVRRLEAPAPPANPVAPAPALPTPVAPVPSVVTIEVAGAPATARVFFDGAAVEGTAIRVVPSAVMVPLRVEADGFAPFAKMVTPDRDQRIEVTLAAAPASSARASHHARARQEAAKAVPAPHRGTRILTDTGEFGDKR